MKKAVELNKYGYYSVIDMPSENELKEYYESKYYQNAVGSYETEYDEAEILFFNNKIKERVYIIEQNLDKASKGKFLDIGCGEGWALSSFKKRGWEVVGLDYSNFGCVKFNPDCVENLITGDIYTNLQELIEKGDKYRVVWLDNVLEHVIDPGFLLKQIKSILDQDGLLIIEVPNDFSFLQNYLLSNNKISRKFWVVIPDHLSYFNKNGLNALLEDCGYENIDMISDYPVDINLLNPDTNYIEEPAKGKACHKERIEFVNLIHLQPIESVIDFYRSCASLGVGRQITGFYKIKSL